MKYSIIEAKYNGTCQGCGGPIIREETIYWNKQDGSYHLECLPVKSKTYKDDYWSGRFEDKQQRFDFDDK